MTGGPSSGRRTLWLTWLLLLIVCCCASATAPPTPSPSAPPLVTPTEALSSPLITPPPATGASGGSSNSNNSNTAGSGGGGDSNSSNAGSDTAGVTTSFVVLAITCGVAAAVGLGLLTACLLYRQRSFWPGRSDDKEGSGAGAGEMGTGGHLCHHRCRNHHHHYRCKAAAAAAAATTASAVVSPAKDSSLVVAPLFADSSAWQAAEEGELEGETDGGDFVKRTTNPLYAVPVRSSSASAAAAAAAAAGCSQRPGGARVSSPQSTATTTATCAADNATSSSMRNDLEEGGGEGRGGDGGGAWQWTFRGATLKPTAATDDSSFSGGKGNGGGGGGVIIGKITTDRVAGASSQTASTDSTRGDSGDVPIEERDATVSRGGNGTRSHAPPPPGRAPGCASGAPRASPFSTVKSVAVAPGPFSTVKSVPMVSKKHPVGEACSCSGSTAAGSEGGSSSGGSGGGSGSGSGGRSSRISGGSGGGGGGGGGCDITGSGIGGRDRGGGCPCPPLHATGTIGGGGGGGNKGTGYRSADPRKRPEWEHIKGARRKSESKARQGPSMLKEAEGVVAGAESLALESFVPGAREVATLVAGLARLAAADHRGDEKDMRRRLQWCRSVVLTLERARSVLGKATKKGDDDNDNNDDAAKRKRLLQLLEDVQESVGDMVEIVQSYKNKHVVSEVFFSTLFRRRQDEADEAIRSAEEHLEPSATEDEPGHQRKNPQTQGILGKAEKKRRQRQQDQVDIPADDVEVMRDEILGMGGFGAVYLADFKGLNVAAKLVTFKANVTLGQDAAPAPADPSSARAHLEGRGGAGVPGVVEEEAVAAVAAPVSDAELNQKARRRAAVSLARRAAACARTEARQRLAVARELEAMKRLRGPHTVHTYGAVTSLKDELVLVMEFLPGGDLLMRLQRARRPLEDGTLRGIVRDVCSGMAFLHGEAFVHGDLKSANVLFDANGRAKIADLGTPLWTQNTNRIATYSARPGGLMSLPWAAPEVLRRERASFKSDVYSFGVVVWECLTRKIPWAGVTGVDNLSRAVKRGERPVVPADAPADLASITKACWASDPAARPTLGLVLAELDSRVHENGAVVGGESGGPVGAGGGDAEAGGVLTTAMAS